MRPLPRAALALPVAAALSACSHARLSDSGAADPGPAADTADPADGAGTGGAGGADGGEDLDPPGFSGLSDSGVYLNELVSDPSEGPDWIELVNLGGADVDLSGWGLTDQWADGGRWAVPDGTVIRAGAYLLIAADDGDSAGEGLSAAFKLSADGETVTLVDAANALADEVELPALAADVAWGRAPDGLGPWTLLGDPSPASGND
jgi:hypothetical protein